MAKKILVLGRDPSTLKGAVDMLNENGYDAHGETVDKQAIQAYQNSHFDGVLLGGGVGPESQQLLIPIFQKINPNIKITKGHPWQALDALSEAFKE